MKNAALRVLALISLVAPCLGCQTGGTILRDGVDVMATPVLWLYQRDDSSRYNRNSSFNSDSWTANKWGPGRSTPN